MLRLTEIWIYPVKSLGGVPLIRSRMLPKGLQYDRRWMLVDDNGVVITQRVHTQMAFFRVHQQGDVFIITHAGDTLELPADAPAGGEPLDVQIWDDRVTAFEVSPYHSQWFSERMRISCRLVSFPEENPRQIDTRYAAAGEHVSLADAYPLLIIGEASLAYLNTLLKEPITMKRFRPNLVFSGGEANDEDNWKAFHIGGQLFEGVKRCDRCVLTTIDPLTGKKGAEPLKTLASYRRVSNKIYFGQNVIGRTQDVISVGDRIEVVSRHDLATTMGAITSNNG